MKQIYRKFIFVHTPKTAGTSLRNSIESIFGKENMLIDNDYPSKDGRIIVNLDNTFSSFFTKNIKQKIIFGHLMPCKYCDFKLSGFHKRKNHLYLTFLREPLQRTISLYYWFMRMGPAHDSPPIVFKLTEEKWSLESFLTYKGFWQNYYARYFFGFPLENFDFIGIMENYFTSIQTLKKMFQEFNEIPIRQDNINEVKPINEFYSIDKDLELKFRQLNNKDYNIYEKGKTINQKLIHEYNA